MRFVYTGHDLLAKAFRRHMMAGKRVEANEDQGRGKQDGGHTSALHADAYSPTLNHRVMNSDGTIAPGKCSAGPKLTDLTIDVGNVHVYDTPRRDASAAERAAAAKREMPISNEHFRDLVKKGAEYIAINGPNFNIQMRNALDEANQSDKSKKTGHKHVDDMLKYINKELCGTSYTLGRQGNKVIVYDTHYDNKPAGKWDLDKKAWDRK